MRHLLQCPGGFQLYTDHRNLTYLFNSDTKVADGNKQSAARLERWMKSMRGFEYQIHHIPGEHNVFADLLSRWGADSVPDAVRAVHEGMTVAGPTQFDPHYAVEFDSYDAPTVMELVDAQTAAVDDEQRVSLGLKHNSDGLLTDINDRVYVPDVRHLRLRLCIAAHQGVAGHRGAHVTSGWLSAQYVWATMSRDVREFCLSCLMCMKTRGAFSVPRPWLDTMHATRPNQVIYFDYTFIREAGADTPDGYTHVLVLTDGYSKFTELVPTTSANAETVVRALLDWFKRFGVVKQWVSDQGSHFLNDVMEQLRVALHADHHFTAAYAPWSNGRVERVGRELREILSSFMLEGLVRDEDWPTILPVVNAAMNNAPCQKLAWYSPLTVHTGAPATSPITVFIRPDTMEVTTAPLTKEQVQEGVEKLRAELEDVYKAIADKKPRKRPPQPGAKEIDFGVGDYVLVARVGKHAKDKTAPIWEGPAKVLEEISKYVYKIEDLGTGLQRSVHAAHLKRYADSELTVTSQLREFASHGGRGFTVGNIIGHQKTNDRWELQVHWEGYTIAEATWEPLQRVYEDVPIRVRQYLKIVKPATVKASMMTELKIEDRQRQNRLKSLE